MENKSESKMKLTPFLQAFTLCLALFCICPNSFSDESTVMGKIVAKVNGEPIYESELVLSLPKSSFGITAERARQHKLDRMIRSRIIRQLLKSEGIEIPKDEIDKEITQLKNKPLSTGCTCCNYPNLEAYMKANSYDMEELRTEVGNGLGFPKYVELQWEKTYPQGEKRNKLLESQRPFLEKEYVKVSHIFFAPDLSGTRDKMSRPNARAQEAWQQLQKGESFENMAKRYSQDMNSRNKGGALGCIQVSSCVEVFREALLSLKPGEYSKPIEIKNEGVCIVRREAIADEDLLLILKDDFITQNGNKIMSKALDTAKIEKTNP